MLIFVKVILKLFFMPDLWLGNDRLQQRKAFKKDISKELMLISWHPKRRSDWCLPEDKKKELKPVFAGKVGKK